jgi:hypothetical protein
LDSFGAERVMKAVKNIAARGTPVVCTIHQPSATLFAMFTHLLLLKKGGYTTYFGPIGDRPGDCSVMLDYFAGALGREAITITARLSAIAVLMAAMRARSGWGRWVTARLADDMATS